MNKPVDEQTKNNFIELYDKFVSLTQQVYQKGRDKSHVGIIIAMQTAKKQMTALGELSSELGNQFQHYLKRDLEQTANDFRKLEEKAKDTLNPSRVGAGALSSMAALLHLGGDALLHLSSKANDALEYKSGELTSAGTLTCMNCKNSVTFNTSTQIQQCHKCQSSTFKKSY